MNKMFINGVEYTWEPLSYQYPDKLTGGSIMVAFPTNDPNAGPLFLIDNNGNDPFASFSYANWLPAFGVTFVDPRKKEEAGS